MLSLNEYEHIKFEGPNTLQYKNCDPVNIALQALTYTTKEQAHEIQRRENSLAERRRETQKMKMQIVELERMSYREIKIIKYCDMQILYFKWQINTTNEDTLIAMYKTANVPIYTYGQKKGYRIVYHISL